MKLAYEVSSRSLYNWHHNWLASDREGREVSSSSRNKGNHDTIFSACKCVREHQNLIAQRDGIKSSLYFVMIKHFVHVV